MLCIESLFSPCWLLLGYLGWELLDAYPRLVATHKRETTASKAHNAIFRINITAFDNFLIHEFLGFWDRFTTQNKIFHNKICKATVRLKYHVFDKFWVIWWAYLLKQSKPFENSKLLTDHAEGNLNMEDTTCSEQAKASLVHLHCMMFI